MNTITVTTYTDPDGVDHHIQVDLDKTGRWVVLDVTAQRTVLIEQLVDTDQGDAAAGLALDYAEQVQAQMAGLRDQQLVPDVLPRPQILTEHKARPTAANTNAGKPIAGHEDQAVAA